MRRPANRASNPGQIVYPRHKRAKTLTGPIALTLGLIAVSVGMLLLAHDARNKALAERTRLSQEARQATDRYRNASNDEPLIRRTIDRFDVLQERGIIGPERRLDWADRLRAMRDSHRFAQLDFELSPQRIVGPLSTPGDYRLASSRMFIRAGLLHEGDFFDLMSELRQPGNAIVAPRRCTLLPSGDQAAQNINLRAECTVEWLTVIAPTEAKP